MRKSYYDYSPYAYNTNFIHLFFNDQFGQDIKVLFWSSYFPQDNDFFFILSRRSQTKSLMLPNFLFIVNWLNFILGRLAVFSAIWLFCMRANFYELVTILNGIDWKNITRIYKIWWMNIGFITIVRNISILDTFSY